MVLFWAAVVVSVLGPLLPYGRNLLYPFALLGTWAHELGHGMMAVALGGGFERLELTPDLGGVAYFGGVGRVATAAVAAGGLLGPAVAGGVVIVLGARPAAARRLLGVLGVVVLISVVLVVRTTFAMVAMTLIGVALVAVGLRAPELVRSGLAQLVGVQFCFASWGSLDYMFTQRFERDGSMIDSDTQNIADVLLLPYWFWGGLIAAASAAIVIGAFVRVWGSPPGFRAPVATSG